MILQHILFPNPDICSEETMFFRRSEGAYFSVDHEVISLDKGAVTQFDTYFNAVSIGKWLKYTAIKSISLKVKVKGSGIMSVSQLDRHHHGFVRTALAQRSVNNTQSQEISIDVTQLSGFGIIYLSVQALDDGFEFCGGNWEAEFERTHDAKIAVLLCTYKREEFVRRNLERLRDYDVFVIDNAQTLAPDTGEHIIPNRNLGGAGGFARGMYEIARLPEFTHILLMDDDVKVHPETVYRVQTLYQTLKPEYADYLIGGAMFRLDLPQIQVEAGVVINPDLTIARLKYGFNLSDPAQCVLNEFEEYCDINAWFCCAIPTKLLADNQLPLPIFFQWDDVEFGLRHRGRFIHLNGICVWHESFEAKMFNLRWYYGYRNQLICAAVHGISPPPKVFLKALRTSLLRELMCMRYKTAEMILDGVEDFLRGPEWLLSLNPEKKNREVIEKCYQLQEPDKLGVRIKWDDLENSIRRNDNSKFHRLFRLLTFNGLPFKANRTVVTSMHDARPVHFYRAGTAIYFDTFTRKAFVIKRDTGEAKLLWRRWLNLSKEFRQRYAAVLYEYLSKHKTFTSVTTWERYFVVSND